MFTSSSPRFQLDLLRNSTNTWKPFNLIFPYEHNAVLTMFSETVQATMKMRKKQTPLTCITLGRMVLLKWSSRVGALKSLLYTSSSSSCKRKTSWHLDLSLTSSANILQLGSMSQKVRDVTTIKAFWCKKKKSGHFKKLTDTRVCCWGQNSTGLVVV